MGAKEKGMRFAVGSSSQLDPGPEGSANGGSGCLWAYMTRWEDGTLELAAFLSGVYMERKQMESQPVP